MRNPSAALTLGLVLTLAGCAGGAAAPARSAAEPSPASGESVSPVMEVTIPTSMRQRRDILTKAQIEATHQKDLYSVVESLRSGWLREKVRDSMTREPTKVQVYMDDTRLGGVEALKSIHPETVMYIQHFDGNDASARWGIGHGQGVIFVSTHPFPGS